MRTRADRDAAREVADLRRKNQQTLEQAGRLAEQMQSELEQLDQVLTNTPQETPR